MQIFFLKKAKKFHWGLDIPIVGRFILVNNAKGIEIKYQLPLKEN
jgi:hypothetical protein